MTLMKGSSLINWILNLKWLLPRLGCSFFSEILCGLPLSPWVLESQISLSCSLTKDLTLITSTGTVKLKSQKPVDADDQKYNSRRALHWWTTEGISSEDVPMQLWNSIHLKLSTTACRWHVLGECAFQAAALHLWNELPLQLRNIGSVDIFKNSIKTFLFRQFFNGG